MLVKINQFYHADAHDMVGVVVESNVNMWGEETVPSGIVVQWSDGTIETLYKDDFKEFLIPKDIYFAPINYNTGKQTDFDDKNFILEAFKKKDINSLNNNQLISNFNYDKLIKFRQFY